MKSRKISGKVKVIIIIVVVVVLIFGAVGLFLKKAVDAAKKAANTGVLVQPLGEQDLSSSINTSGKIESQHVVAVTTEMNSRIKTLNVSLGDYVEAGQVLCTFDDTEIREQIQDLEKQISTAQQAAANQTRIVQRNLADARENRGVELSNAQNQLQLARDQCVDLEAAVTEARDHLDQVKKDHPTDLDMISEANAVLKEAEGALTGGRSAITQAEASYYAVDKSTNQAIQAAQDAVDSDALAAPQSGEASKTLAKLYRQLDSVTVKAEQAGIITSLNVSQGSIPNGTMMQIEDPKNLKVVVNLKEGDIFKVKEGMEAVVLAKALPEETNGGKVSKVINFASSRNVTQGNAAGAMNMPANTGASGGGTSADYSAEVAVNEGSSLLLGMTVKVEIVLEQMGMRLAVPYESLLTDDDGVRYVYRAVKGEGEEETCTIERVDVEIGCEGEYYTEIKSDLLNQGDYIVISPEGVQEGDVMPVSVAGEGELGAGGADSVAE